MLSWVQTSQSVLARFPSHVETVWLETEDAVGIHLAVQSKQSIAMHWGEQ